MHPYKFRITLNWKFRFFFFGQFSVWNRWTAIRLFVAGIRLFSYESKRPWVSLPTPPHVLKCSDHKKQNVHFNCRWAGVALWNNLLENPNNKSTNWVSPQKRFLCPTEVHPYFFTNDNYFNDPTESTVNSIHEIWIVTPWATNDTST